MSIRLRKAPFIILICIVALFLLADHNEPGTIDRVIAEGKAQNEGNKKTCDRCGERVLFADTQNGETLCIDCSDRETTGHPATLALYIAFAIVAFMVFSVFVSIEKGGKSLNLNVAMLLLIGLMVTAVSQMLGA